MFKFFLSTILLGFFGILGLEAVEEKSSILILNMKDEAVLPRNFHTVEDQFKKKEGRVPSEEGLRTLRMSGSGQFSEKSLKAMLCHLGNPPHFYIIDLRQESHGFLNGTAVSWYSKKNQENIGKSVSQILCEEKALLKKELGHKEIILSKVAQKDLDGLNLPDVSSIPFVVYEIGTEGEVAERLNVHYLRIPVPDYFAPTDEMVDLFIHLIKQLPKESWVHFHCAAGVGRTTTFMVLYDMMKNAKKVSFEDIIRRHDLLGGKGLDVFGPKENWRYANYVKRYEFVKEFYQYCKTNQNDYSVSWTEYIHAK